MKATDIVNKVELEVDYQKLIELMRAGRQVDFVLPAPETDGDGYLTWDTEYWTTVDNKRFIRGQNDRGVVLLLADRFSTPAYLRLFPEHWHHARIVYDNDGVSKILHDFWSESSID